MYEQGGPSNVNAERRNRTCAAGRLSTQRVTLGQVNTRVAVASLVSAPVLWPPFLLTAMPLRQREEYEDDNYLNYEDWEPQPKRRRLRGRRGGLENLPQMPLDIIIEVRTLSTFRKTRTAHTPQILGYLKPLDLLNLARTSVDFRKYLMARSAAPLWKSTRKNVEGLPDCPAHLNEPQYANLVFDTHCHVRPALSFPIHAG